MLIYRIISDLPDGRFLCYIGSTSKKLNERLNQHMYDYKQYLNGKYHYVTSFKLVCRQWFEIALIEDLGNCSKDYMLDKEAYYINYYKSLSDEYEVINKYNPNEIDIDKAKKYRQLNKYKEYQKEYNKLYSKKYEQTEKRKEYKKNYNRNYRQNKK